MGFGKYSKVIVSDIYSGTPKIPLDLWRICIEAIFRAELTPANFSCASYNELEEIINQEKEKVVDEEVLKSLLIHRLNSLLKKESEKAWPDLRQNIIFVPEEYEYKKIEISKSICAPKGDFINFFEDYFSALVVPMTSKDWQFVQTSFVKNYIIFSSAGDDLFESFTLNCFSLAKDILDKHWQDESWSESWDPPHAIPLIINLKKTIPPIYNSGPECILTYGTPTYLDWALRETEFFITPRSLEHLETLDVLMAPDIILSKVAEDVLSWTVLNRTYKYKFSTEAKELNQRKYDNYRASLEEDNSASRGEFERYTQQDAIDDAFGGEESAYWNID